MKVVHISQTDTLGGAGIASYRLHQGLRKEGVDSLMLVAQKATTDRSVIRVEVPVGLETSVSAIKNSYIAHNRTDLSNSHFSLSLTGLDLARHPQVVEADVIHLHWIPDLLNPNGVGEIFRLGKPVFWTLHDMNPFTGGCHFTAGCREFEVACDSCPQLEDDPFHLTAAVLRDKHDLWDLDNVTLISPSHWMARQLKSSRIFRNHADVVTIPNCIDTDEFRVISKLEARRELGITSTGPVLLIAAESAHEQRKGGREALEVLRTCCKNNRFLSSQPTLLQVGQPDKCLSELPIPVIELGWIDSLSTLTSSFAASDFFILPSLEDNLPNMAVEAACCGLPVCGFEIGGMPDIVKDGGTGFLVPPNDLKSLAKKVISLTLNREMRERMGGNSAEFARDTFRFRSVIPVMTELYRRKAEEHDDASAFLSEAGETEIQRRSTKSSITDCLPQIKAHCQDREIQRLTRELERHQRICEQRQDVIDDLCSEIEMLRNECRDRLELIKRNRVSIARIKDLWKNG